ncbi:uncharacterized protein DDB_G0292642-like [Ruditapes philippinarum]|uniref:uncharacterized protein DDB_G0292642-like n=1 Tax=Ruditapes philippinarum TaxID=129788 RepID=UPI00295B3262|nr:uncharacterized protein DDB_G0292642-like [Ruditapes philippinarum]
MPGKTLQLFLKGIEGKTTIVRINEDATIADLRKQVSDITHIKDDDLRVLYCSKELRAKDESGATQTLEDYNIGDQANLFVVLRLLGGSQTENEGQPKMYDSEVQLTDKPDMFTMDDEEGGQRAEMPCRHAISPESLTAFCRSLLTAGKFEFRCPYKASTDAPFCDQIWEFFTVKRLAVLTSEEMKEFETKVTENYLRKAVGIQECPKCESFCERRNKADQRVICPICTRKKGKLYEFCWFCLRSWLTSDTKDCGNFGCTGKDPRLRIIENCPKKMVVEVPNCPAIRACPTCGLLIEHKEQCKQMQCPCGQKFCFICLKKANTAGRYQCGAWNFKCTVAPVQTAIPGN